MPFYKECKACWMATVLLLKVDVLGKNCTWYKIMTITFWRDWRSSTPMNPKSIVSKLEGLVVVDPISF
jgi:hypothetical protein